MKILEMTLTNFARVFSGMGKTKIVLDFRNVNEKINLFVGPNGSGKTSILRCLHPFAYNSAMGDGTTNSNLIIKGKDGKKTILIYADDDHIYYIQHIYTRTKDGNLTVKSYIAENNEELNDSGVSTTFKSIVRDKLGIDENYLTLLSMSNSIKGFVEYTAGNRKSYASKIFTELDVYSKKYKELQSQDRAMKSLLANVSSKLSRYANIDRAELRNEVASAIKNLEMLNQKHSLSVSNIGNIQGQLDSLSYISTEYNKYQTELTQDLQLLTILKSKLSSSDDLLTIKEKKKTLMIKKAELEAEMNKVADNVRQLLDMKSSMVDRKSKLEDDIAKFKIGSSVEELETHEKYLISELSKIKEESGFDPNTFKSNIDKNELVRTVIYLDELTSIMHNMIYDVNRHDDIISVYELYRRGKISIAELRKEYDKAVADREQYEAIHNQGMVIKIPSIRHSCTDPNCPYKAFYDRYVEMAVAAKDPESSIKLRVNESRLENMISIINVIQKAEAHIDKYKDFLKNNEVLRDLGIFDESSFVEKYMETKCVYDTEKASVYIDMLEYKIKYDQVQESLNLCREKLELYRANESVYTGLKTELEYCTDSINKFDEQIDSLKTQIKDDEIFNIENSICVLESDEAVLEQLGSLQKNMLDLQGKLNNMQASMDNINSLQSKLDNYRIEEQTIQNDIQALTHRKEQLSLAMTNIETLEAEEIELRKNYDLIDYIRFAVSPNTGLPVEFIKYYIKEEMADRINTLLDTVYHGRLQILKDQITIDEDNFTIPYIKNQTTVVDDISMASDGEKAILSLAFSLVLIQLTQTNTNKLYYTIILLDEMDATLDLESRSKFIDLLEIFMGTINAGQTFLISHNNMFDSYPVNVILTGEMETFNYSNANVMRLHDAS